MRLVLNALPLAMVLLSGCSPAESLSAPIQPPDNSLPASEYIAQGLAAPDRSWTGEDYSRAVVVLKKVAEADVTTLPRVGSAKSGSTFERLVSPDNIALATTPGFTQQQHLAALVALLQGVSQVASVYVVASQQKGVFDSEMVDLSRYLLDVTTAVVPVAESFLSTLPADDPDIEARLKGRDQAKQGIATVVSGCLTTLTEHSSYRTAELVRLSRTLEQSVPRIHSFLPQGFQQELPVRLRSMIEAESDPALKDSLSRLQKALTATSPPTT